MKASNSTDILQQRAFRLCEDEQLVLIMWPSGTQKQTEDEFPILESLDQKTIHLHIWYEAHLDKYLRPRVWE